MFDETDVWLDWCVGQTYTRSDRLLKKKKNLYESNQYEERGHTNVEGQIIAGPL